MTLFLQGVSLRVISERINVPLGTVCGWSKKNNWGELRREFIAEQREKLVRQIGEKIEQNALQYLEASRILSNMCCRQLKSAHQESKDDDILLKDWPRLMNAMAGAQKSVVPNFAEELGQRIVNKLFGICDENQEDSDKPD